MTVDPRTEDAVAVEELRASMVDRLAAAQPLSAEVARAFRTVPRHLFLPGVARERVYSGAAIPTRFDDAGRAISSSSEVAVMAPMIEGLALEHGQRVLEIGAGTGYNAAIIAEIVGDAGSVTTIDIDPTITNDARVHLTEAGYARVDVVTGDGWQAWLPSAPYDRIVVTASAADLSPEWVHQLVEGGLLCVPLLFRANAFTIPVFRRERDLLRSVAIIPGGFMPLRGAGAPPDGSRTLGDWSYTSGRAIDERKLAELLRQRPRVELGGEWDWKAAALLAFVEPDAITLLRAGRAMAAIGIFDGEGLAVIELAGGNVAGSRLLYASAGAPATAARLRERLAQLAERGWGDVEIVAVPVGGARPPGTNVIERSNYVFGASLPT
jgi:protein-L-isoaspartate(D-aspartate) O-methyltransferase